ncbi:MAG: hypothetical protein AAF845_06730 [Bacteroidota bacterium]
MTTLIPLARRAAAVLLGALLLSTSASAERTPGEADGPSVLTPEAAAALAASTNAAECTLGSAIVNIDVNNIRAELYNIGGLFWRGAGAVYEVPKGSNIQSVFASGIWMAGLLDEDGDGTGDPDTDLRFAGQTYSSWEYWPGPLDENGETTQARCQSFDKLWSVYFDDIEGFANGTAEGTEVNGRAISFADLQSWPIAQGAPFYVDTNGNNRRDAIDSDGDGEEDEPRIELNIGDPGYSLEFGAGRQLNLEAGERPDIIGDQSVWWVMNDNGNTHGWSGKPALEMEIRAQAFAFRTADAINNTTFYRYQFLYRGSAPLIESYVALWSDPDLGNFGDDYVGSDLDLGLGFVYNGDNNDQGAGGYGLLPPALGYDFFQGPLVNDDGEDNDGDGETDEVDERLQVETFFYFTNQGGPTGDPTSTEDRGLVSYRLMQGIWKDGVPMTVGGDGYNPGSTNFTQFAFPGDPPGFWSEYNSDGLGRANLPDDRRFGVSTGPFTFEPGDIQELVFGIVWAIAPQECQSTATPQITSLQQLKFDDITVQGAFNANFNLPSPPPSVVVEATELDQEVILDFESVTGNNSDIFLYEVTSPFATPDAADQTYNFEGFRIFQYRSPTDNDGTLVATFDLNNSITTVLDSRLDCSTGAVITGVVAQGANTGTASVTPTSISIENDIFTGEPLRNNTTYFFGVQPYAHNEASSPNKVFAAPVTRVTARPTLADARNDGTVVNASTGQSLETVAAPTNGGEGSLTARVVDPAELNGDVYRVEFFSQLDGDGAPVGTNYRIVNATTSEVVLDGEDFFARTGNVLEQQINVARAGGLAFDVLGPSPTFTNFIATANADGPIAPPFAGASADFQGYPVPARPFFAAFGGDANGISQQIYADADNVTGLAWFLGPAEALTGHTFDEFLTNVGSLGTGPGTREDNVSAFDFEMRFTEGPNFAAIYSETGTFGDPRLIEVPFELWNIGIGTPDDPSDDVRYFPTIFDLDFNVNQGFNLITGFGIQETFGQFPFESVMSSLQNDPYSDGISWVIPPDATPGQGGYDALVSAIQTDAAAAEPTLAGAEISLRRMALVLWNGGDPCPEADDAGVCASNDVPFDINLVPEQGTVFRITTSKPNQPGDVFTVDTGQAAVTLADATTAEAALDLIAVTPNPYRGASEYELGGEDNIVRFVNLPAEATLRVFTLSGTLLRTIEKPNDGSTTVDWNLQTEARLPVASGIYLIHVDARDSNGASIGERVLKFAVIQRRVQLDVF